MKTRAIRSREFVADRAWGALPLAAFDSASTVRLHWTDAPYHWHVNDGDEVFAVLDGTVNMVWIESGRDGNIERETRLEVGDVFCAAAGTAHVAHPVGVARILVVERAGSE
ncbi:cupin [Andreprevotia chitinilytica]|uniref:cupin n=1 Tax=Andreprevotia chitinilytica TaxID=396808 RepID=UPI00054F5938|nr:cupin [Andreprevotia chitinilytica]